MQQTGTGRGGTGAPARDGGHGGWARKWGHRGAIIGTGGQVRARDEGCDLAGVAGGGVFMRAGGLGEERGRAVGLVSGGFQRAGRWSDRPPTVDWSGRAARAGGSGLGVAWNM